MARASEMASMDIRICACEVQHKAEQLRTELRGPTSRAFITRTLV
jgi:hypothetical protein